ncbi:MAG: site-2 protease family protein [Acidimicrobiia bacterium]|nr:site-2 protease family protein [Acidimicrobiia bacterium]
MRPSVRLGRIAHIEVGIHWSVLVIMVLLVWSLAGATLPELAPGSSDPVYWIAAVVGVLLLFTSLLAHELAHSVVAERRGVSVEGITLWLLGGVSQLHGEAKTPRDEFDITAAGPLTSVALALGFGALAGFAAAIGGPTVLVAVLGWLAVINGVLAVFNLIPGAPLDGGRLLHAAVWHRSGDRSRATMVATRAGGRVGYTLIGLGILLLLLGDLSAAWFVLLGWFLLAASRAEATHELLHGALAGVRTRDVMTARPIVAPEDVPLSTLVDDWFLGHDCSAFPLAAADGTVTGLITLARVKSIPRHDWDRVTAGEVAEPIESLATGAPNEPFPEMLERISVAAGGGGRALIFDGGSLVGIITPTDVQRTVDLAALRSPRPRLESAASPRTPTPGGGVR